MKSQFSLKILTTTALVSLTVVAPVHCAMAQNVAPPAAANNTAKAQEVTIEEIVVTGSRIPRKDLQGISPVAVTSGETLKLQRAVTIEDFSSKLPQLGGGTNSAATGNQSYGAQTLDLRSLGQDRTLVLINGTRAAPFSFRNAADVNAIPAPLLKRVDVLTGGAAAVYGADAVAGVVNFIIDDKYQGLALNGNYRTGDGGGAQYGVNATYGTALGDKGHVAVYAEYTKRDVLLAGHRSFAVANESPASNAGGNFTDTVSGNKFSFTDAGQLVLSPAARLKTSYVKDFILLDPLKRINASLFFNYNLTDKIEAYGRAMFTDVRTTGASLLGQYPILEQKRGNDIAIQIAETNPFLTPQIRSQLTFVNGLADVGVNRYIGEAGIVTADTKRTTYQGQIGLRGPIWQNIKWDAYIQLSRVRDTTFINNALRPDAPSFASIVNIYNIFGPGDKGLATALSGRFLQNDAKRDQLNGALSIAGDSKGIFELPAGPVGFSLGYEYRRDKGFNNETGNDPFNGNLSSNEGYGELLIPVLKDLPLVKSLSLEGAYRLSAYSNSGTNGSFKIGTFGTKKLGASWAVTDDLRFRGAWQTVIRAPNIGEADGARASIPYNLLRIVTRLKPRYQGDPCALGTGNAAQCAALGFKGTYDSLDPANLVGNYFFGGNPGIKPEKGNTYTIGAVLTPRFIPGFSATVDYYKIKLNDAVGVIQPVAALNSCYVLSPTPNNPTCKVVSRDPTTGYLLDAFIVDTNLGTIQQRGFDIDVAYSVNLPENFPGKRIGFRYNANIVTGYTLQTYPGAPVKDCKGTYGADCSTGETFVQASYKHRVSLNWSSDKLTTQIGWQRIGSVRDSSLGSTDRIAAQDYFDLSISIKPVEWATINVGADNIFGKLPPLPNNAGAFNTYPDTYNVIGRTVGISLTLKH